MRNFLHGARTAVRPAHLLGAALLLAACGQTPATPGGTPGPGGNTPPTNQAPQLGGLRWSDPTTWQKLGQSVPSDGSTITIPAGQTVLLDTDTPALASLTIDGTLNVSDTYADTNDNDTLDVTSGIIVVHGDLNAGSEHTPYSKTLTFTLTDPDTTRDIMNMGTRGILVMGGTLSLHAPTPPSVWTKLNAHAPAGATQLQVLSTTGWRAGDRVAVAPTDFYGVGETEAFTVTALSGNTVTLDRPLLKSRWGTLQTFDGGRVTVDQRAEVVNLTRNIRIQAPNDAAWRDLGFGVQVKNMGGELKLSGVEVRRAGQAGRLGMYPLHWHGLSYDLSGAELGDAAGQYVRGSVITGSRNRCLVIHGTNGVRVQDNVCHDVTGHAVFLEDGVERRNTITGNVVLKVRDPAAELALQQHELRGFQRGSSGFWISNPDNTVNGNIVADAQGSGFWLSFADRPVGLFKSVPVSPDNGRFGTFDDNVARGNGQLGLNLDWVAKDDAGNVEPRKYMPTQSETWQGNYSELVPFTVNRFQSYKHTNGATWHRTWGFTMRDFVLADNAGTGFSGAAHACRITNSAVVGISANNATEAPPHRPPAGAATYHSLCDITSNTFINLPFVSGKTSGAFATNDYYITPVDKGLARNADNRLVNAHPGFRTPLPNDNWVLAGALWDPYGHWGPAGNYWTYDLPFLTHGTTCQPVAPAGQNGKSCAGPYYGLSSFSADGSGMYRPMMALEVTRHDNGAVWAVGNGNEARMLGNMRHAALLKGKSYTLRFPDLSAPRELSFGVTNMLAADDWVMLAVPYDGATTPRAWATTWPNYTWESQFEQGGFPAAMLRRMTAASSLAQVEVSNGEVFWQDRASNLVWFKVKGGLQPRNAQPGSDTALYQPMHIVLRPAL